MADRSGKSLLETSAINIPMSSAANPTHMLNLHQRRTDSARDLFQKYADPDSNTIDREGFAELHKGIMSTSKDQSPSRLSALSFANTFDDYDDDGDGVLTWNEFVDVHNAIIAFELSANRASTILSLNQHRTHSIDQPTTRSPTMPSISNPTSPTVKKNKTRGSVIGDVGFAAGYKLTKSNQRYDTVNFSNNYVGRGVVQWVQKFDTHQNMRNMVAQNAQLKDKDVCRLVRHLIHHPTIKRLDVRGNRLLDASTFRSLETLAEKNKRMTEILVDDQNLSGSAFAAVKSMHKHLAKNRWSLCTAGIIPSAKPGALASLVHNLLGKNKNKNDNDNNATSPLSVLARQNAQEFLRSSALQRVHQTWGGAQIMHSLYAAKSRVRKQWTREVQKGQDRRDSIRQTTFQQAEGGGVQFTGMHRPSSMKDLRGQGNLSLYSDAALLQRKGLREHPAIVACIHRWWYCLLIPTFDANRNGKLDKDEYMIFHKCLNMALQSGVEGLDNRTPLSPAVQTQMALEDWEEDTQGTGSVNIERFKSALFELVDMWTETTDPQEYLDFLEYLFGSMCKAMEKFPTMTERQRQNIQFQVKQHRYLANAERSKRARMEALGLEHDFDDDTLAKLHRDFERLCDEEREERESGGLKKRGARRIRASCHGGAFQEVKKKKKREKEKKEEEGGSGSEEEEEEEELSCSRETFDKLMEMQGFSPSSTTGRLFELFDSDHSGTIDFREMIVGLTLLGRGLDTETLAKRCFRLYVTCRQRLFRMIEVLEQR